MGDIKKYRSEEVNYQIRHALRALPEGKYSGNDSINPELTASNYSLLEGRCQTAAEAIKYRKNLEKEIFKYNRKNLVHAVNWAVQCPNDCPPDQKELFFKETYKYICSTLPMGEKCVLVAQVHVDEKHFSPTGELISKDHLHIIYVPAVEDTKHDGFSYRLCADQLTKKAQLKAFHPGLQKHLNDVGIMATVYRKKEGDGRSISLSVSQLKEFTKKTGITLDHSLTVDELSQIINANILKGKQLQIMKEELSKKDAQIESLTAKLSAKENALSNLHQNELSPGSKTAKTEHKNQENLPGYTWGSDTSWGQSPGWGNRSIKTIENEEER